jgi:hypothetical protein
MRDAPQMNGTTLSSTLLPKAKGLTDALLAPSGPGITPGEQTVLRTRLQDALTPLAGGGPIRMNGYLLRTALLAPERGMDDSPFHWSSRTARRSIGIVAARHCVRGLARTPGEAVAITVAQLAEDGRQGQGRRGSLAQWLALVPEGGRAAVRAEATTWATHLLEALEWGRLRPPPVIGGPDQWWDCPSAPAVGLRGRADVRVLVPDNPAATALLTMVGGQPGPTSGVELGLAALVAVLTRPAAPAPARVVGWWPDCGRALVLAVDLPMLRQTANAVVATARVVGGTRRQLMKAA